MATGYANKWGVGDGADTVMRPCITTYIYIQHGFCRHTGLTSIRALDMKTMYLLIG